MQFPSTKRRCLLLCLLLYLLLKTLSLFPILMPYSPLEIKTSLTVTNWTSLDHAYRISLFDTQSRLELAHSHLQFPSKSTRGYRKFTKKYFNDDGKHYDKRYFVQGNEVKVDEILRRLVHAWSQFTQSNEIISWISHGTLLGA